MAVNTNPTGIFSGDYEYNADGTNVSDSNAGVWIPLASLPGVDATEANLDHRKVLWGILDQYYEQIDGQADQPEKMTVSRSSLSLKDSDTVRRSYTVTFDFDISGFDIDAE
jgi:hypothetical protein